MLLSFEEFARRTDAVREKIAAACAQVARDPAEVELLAVTKTHSALAVDYAARYGLRAVGENRVQEADQKRPQTTAKIDWELIGHLQSNKAKLAVKCFERIQSVDSEKLLTHLDHAAADAGKVLPVLLQINAGHDPAKFGADLEAAPALLEAALNKKNLRVDGFMTVAPLLADPLAMSDAAEHTFANLRELRDRLATQFKRPLRVLSMGMTSDLDAAVRAGSTLVRVGSALYGTRAAPPA